MKFLKPIPGHKFRMKNGDTAKIYFRYKCVITGRVSYKGIIYGDEWDWKANGECITKRWGYGLIKDLGPYIPKWDHLAKLCTRPKKR